MQCEYCGKTVRDMPNHLSKNKKCIERHGAKLQNELKYVLSLYYSQNDNGRKNEK